LGTYFVYILRCSDGTLYTGSTSDIARRVEEHNAGAGARYTRTRTPVALAYLEMRPSRGKALKREYEIKKLRRTEKLLLCADYEAKQHSIR
jgi:predicted GIY-YIG superfamily endonuclease